MNEARDGEIVIPANLCCFGSMLPKLVRIETHCSGDQVAFLAIVGRCPGIR